MPRLAFVSVASIEKVQAHSAGVHDLHRCSWHREHVRISTEGHDDTENLVSEIPVDSRRI